MTREQIHIGDMSHETAIGILKLMLEAMETYDGISPTPQRINAMKMAIKALEQETVSKESYDHEYFLRKEFEFKLAKLEHDKNDVIDKIRAEIKELDDKLCRQFLIEDADKEVHRAYRECLEIIDKYKAESEDA